MALFQPVGARECRRLKRRKDILSVNVKEASATLRLSPFSRGSSREERVALADKEV